MLTRRSQRVIKQLYATAYRNRPLIILAVFTWLYILRKRRREERKSKILKISEKDETNFIESHNDSESVIWVPNNDKHVKVTIKHIPETQFDLDAPLFAKRRGYFAQEAKALLHIMFPRLNCRATHYLAVHMLLLMLRTYLSLIVAELDGRIVRNLMSSNAYGFARGLFEWFALAIPASYTNAFIKYFENQIALTFRETLTRYIHDLYVGKNQEYYKIGSLDGELQNLDQYIANDVTLFCTAAARLYSSLGKPILDLGIFSAQLSRKLGGKATLGIFMNYFATATLLKYISPAFGRLTARETKLEGEYRNSHSNILTNAEEIAFYDGAKIEKKTLAGSFRKLKHHIAKEIRRRAWYSIIENYVLKYSWSASGFLFASVPVFFPSMASTVASESDSQDSKEYGNIGRFVTNKRMMLAISDAGGRIMYSIKDLAELASYTSRVYQLIAALHRVRTGKIANTEALKGNASFTMADIKGKFEIVNEAKISFQNIPVVVPGHGCDMSSGEVILNPVTFEVNQNEHLLIIGSNGTGKTSIARLAAGMWPVYRGLLRRSKDVAFLSQRPYFSQSTLRDQVIYPQTHYQMLQSGRNDDEILRILERVRLSYLPEREGGLDSKKEWKDVLSGGEKQRLLFARLLYAKPRFAIIDEGTSAVSSDVEGLLYEECKKDNITLLTITHRISLLKYHSAKLEVGLGSDNTEWSLESASTKGWQSLDAEIEQLEEFISEIPKLTERRKEIVAELSQSLS